MYTILNGVHDIEIEVYVVSSATFKALFDARCLSHLYILDTDIPNEF